MNQARTLNDLLPEIQVNSVLPEDSADKIWNDRSYFQLKAKLKKTYDELVFYRRNLFLVPTGRSGKDFIKELTFWLKQINNGTKLNGVVINAFMVLPSLLLQKPSAKSKAKEYSSSLERRITTWKREDIVELMREARQIQRKFKHIEEEEKPWRCIQDIQQTSNGG